MKRLYDVLGCRVGVDLTRIVSLTRFGSTHIGQLIAASEEACRREWEFESWSPVVCKALIQNIKLWLGFLDTYRTLCIDPPQEIRTIFEEVRAADWLECTRPNGKHSELGGATPSS
jgi:hypothetical protein